MARTTYIYCKSCLKVVEKYQGCEHAVYSSSSRSAAPLAVYYEGPDGNIQIPGKVGRMPERLRRLGYQEKTIQDSVQYSQFCRRMDSEARRKHERYIEARNRQFEAQQKQVRDELRQQLESQFGRDFLEAAIQASQQDYSESYHAGSHLEGYEYNTKRGRD